MCRRLLVCVIMSMILSGTSSHAGVQVYTDRATWQAALGGTPTWYIDFNGFIVDAYAPLDLGFFAVSTAGSSALAFVDAPPFINPDPTFDGTSHLFLFVDGTTSPPSTVMIVFHDPATCFGGEFSYPGNGSQLVMDLAAPGGGVVQSIIVPGGGSTQAFFGFVSTDPISSIVFHNTVNDGFLVDNVAGGPTGVVPVATTSWGKLKALYR